MSWFRPMGAPDADSVTVFGIFPVGRHSDRVAGGDARGHG